MQVGEELALSPARLRELAVEVLLAEAGTKLDRRCVATLCRILAAERAPDA